MDRILLDDDQFFGVNERSGEQSRQQRIRFENIRSVIEVLDDAYQLGIRTFMCTTHERVGEICAHVRAHPSVYRDLAFYPCLPEGHKYAVSVAEVGILETIRRFSTGGVVSTLLRSARGAITQDIYELMRLLVDAEMKRFEGLHTPIVFLTHVVTDLVLGMKMNDLYAELSRYLRERYDAEAGFATMNLPALLDALAAAGIENPVVCAHINKLGFRMSGGIAQYERVLSERKFRAIARGVTPGSLPAEDGLAYVCRHKTIASIVVQAASKDELTAVQALITRLDADATSATKATSATSAS